MCELKFGNTRIPYHVLRGRSSKYLHLRMMRSLELEVILPRNRHIDVESALEKKQRWIERKYEEMRNSRPVFNGNHILFQGEYYGLHLVKSDQDNHGNPLLADGKLILPIEGSTNPDEAIELWMTRRTEEYVDRRVPALAKQLGLRYQSLTVKGLSKWGYCTKDRDLIFSWQLSALPEELAEYVILHELTHLTEFNHSKNFRSRLAFLCPDYKERQMALRQIYASSPLHTSSHRVLPNNLRIHAG